MNRRFSLATLLRVRKVQEDVARAELARARATERGTDAEVDLRSARQASYRRPQDGPAAAYLGAVTAGLGRASDLSASRAVQAAARAATAEAQQGWSTAAGRVEGLESLAARHREAVRRADDKAAQRELDDRPRRPEDDR